MIKFELNERQKKLFDFVSVCHGGQVRKYNGEPYTNHLLSVARMVFCVDEPLIVEIALGHDLLEDTECTDMDLFDFLLRNGYDGFDCDMIFHGIVELTDYFTKERFPKMNRKERKKKEAERLGRISRIAQAVKYADLIDNTSTIAYLDPGFAKTYLTEKRDILDKMRDGDIDLFIQACASYHNAMEFLSHLKGLKEQM